MYINNINNSHNLEFAALKKISCSGAGTFMRCSFNEGLIADELKKIVKTDSFFENYDVKAFISGYRGIMSLKLIYKPLAKSFLEKLKIFFQPGRVIELAEKRNCTTDATYYLAKRLRKTVTFTDYIEEE